MDFLEKDLENIIWDAFNEDPEILESRGLFMRGTAFRQLNLGSYGVADIVTFFLHINRDFRGKYFRSLYVHVYELKKDQVNMETLLQASRYCKGVERMIEKDLRSHIGQIEFRITLIGKSIEEKSDFIFLTDRIENLQLLTYSADIKKGFVFNNHKDYFMSNEMRGVITKSEQYKLREIITNAKEHFNLYGQEIY